MSYPREWFTSAVSVRFDDGEPNLYAATEYGTLRDARIRGVAFDLKDARIEARHTNRRIVEYSYTIACNGRIAERVLIVDGKTLTRWRRRDARGVV